MKKNSLNLIIISIIFIIASIIFYGKCGNLYIDFSRESYIPYQLLQGDELNQDIFLIYGPFGYLFNALLYKINININMLLIESNVLSYVILILFYFIVKKFTTYNIALYFSIFFIFVSIFSSSTFSFATPYSYSTLWAISGLYLILYAILYKKNKLIYITLGFISINKIELFILTLTLILIYDIINKKFSIKNYLFCAIFPLLILPFLDLGNYLNNIQYLNKMVHTNAIETLYKGMGAYCKTENFTLCLKNLLKLISISAISYFIYKKSKIPSIIILLIFLIQIKINEYFYLSAFVALIITLMNFKKLKKRDWILLFIGIILSSKSVFATSPYLYSNYGFAIILFYIYRQLNFMLNKQWLYYSYLLITSTYLMFTLFQHGAWKKTPVKTDIGNIWLNSDNRYLTEKINDFITKNVKNDEDFIVVPEGQIFNLMHKKPWKFYNSTFIPLDFETFGEENIIQKLKENKTDYIIFYPRNTKEYGKETICYDYGIDFCIYIMDNYNRVALYENKQKALIFKINEK